MRLATVLILIFIVASVGLPAFAQTQCGSHDEVATALGQQFGETVVAQGITDDGRLTEIWANPGTGSWTMTTTLPNGVTCLQYAGVGFRAAKPGEPA